MLLCAVVVLDSRRVDGGHAQLVAVERAFAESNATFLRHSRNVALAAKILL